MKFLPSKLPTNQFDHFYLGGNKIGALRHGPGGPMRPEEWIASTTTRFGEKKLGLSQLASGEYLVDAVSSDPLTWLGAEHAAAYGASTEILVKLLDPDQRLPVHYHPNRAFAAQHLALTHGKTEAWIILEAPVGATVGLGFKREHSKAEIAALVSAHDATSLLDALQHIPVKAGDSILVPAGVPHAIGAGIFIVELQEPTDLSILLEWNDFAVDGEVDGHLGLGFDLALDALRYTPILPVEMTQFISENGAFGAIDFDIFLAAANPYFRADFLSGSSAAIAAGFAILIVLGGVGEIEFTNTPSISVAPGDAVVIPYAAGSWSLKGAHGIVSRPPLPKNRHLAV